MPPLHRITRFDNPGGNVPLARLQGIAAPQVNDGYRGLDRDLQGVGLESVTAIHLPEELSALDVYLRPQIETYLCRDRHGELHEVRTRRHWRLDRDFPKFGPALQKTGELEVGAIEGCCYQIVSMRALLRDVFRAFEGGSPGTLREGQPSAA